MITTIEELEHVRQNCRALVRRRARAAAVISAAPVPGVDLAGDLALLLSVIPEINRRFGLASEQIDKLDNPTKVIVYRLVRRIGARFIGQALTVDLLVSTIANFGVSFAAESIAKYVPVVGTIASGVITYEIFKRIAYRHIEECTRVTREVIEERSRPAPESAE